MAIRSPVVTSSFPLVADALGGGGGGGGGRGGRSGGDDEIGGLGDCVIYPLDVAYFLYFAPNFEIIYIHLFSEKNYSFMKKC
jgi:hypothetical protein